MGRFGIFGGNRCANNSNQNNQPQQRCATSRTPHYQDLNQLNCTPCHEVRVQYGCPPQGNLNSYPPANSNFRQQSTHQNYNSKPALAPTQMQHGIDKDGNIVVTFKNAHESNISLGIRRSDGQTTTGLGSTNLRSANGETFGKVDMNGFYKMEATHNGNSSTVTVTFPPGVSAANIRLGNKTHSIYRSNYPQPHGQPEIKPQANGKSETPRQTVPNIPEKKPVPETAKIETKPEIEESVKPSPDPKPAKETKTTPEETPKTTPDVKAAETKSPINPAAVNPSAHTTPPTNPDAVVNRPQNSKPINPNAIVNNSKSEKPINPAAVNPSANTTPPINPDAVVNTPQSSKPINPDAIVNNSKSGIPVNPAAVNTSANTTSPINPNAVISAPESGKPIDPSAVNTSPSTGRPINPAAINASDSANPAIDPNAVNKSPNPTGAGKPINPAAVNPNTNPGKVINPDAIDTSSNTSPKINPAAVNNTPQTGKPINPAAISLEQAQVKLPKIDADAALNAKSREFLKNVLASPEAKKTIVRAAAKDSFGVDPGNDISPDFAKELADQIKSLDEKKGDKSGAELLSLEKLPSDLSNLKVEIAKAAMQRSFGKLDSDWSDPKTYEEAKDQLKNNAKDSAEVLNLLSRIEAEEKLRPAPVLKLINPAAVATDTDSKSDINPAAVANKNPINQDAVVSTVIPSDVLEKSLARLDNYMKADKSIYHDSATGLFNAIRKEYGAKGATELHEAYKEKFGISIGRSLDDIYIYEMNKPLLSAVYGTDVVSSMIKIKNIEKQWFTKGDTIELVNQLKKDGLLDKVREAWDEFTDVKRYPGLDFNSRVKYLTGSDDKQLRELLN